MSEDVRVRELGEAEYDGWTDFVSRSPDGSIYSLPAYLDTLCLAAGGGFHVLGAFHGDELVGGIALYEQRSRYGTYVAPRSLLYYNGLVLRHYETKYPSENTARCLHTTSALVAAISARGYAWIKLRCGSSVQDVRPFLAERWGAVPHYTYVVPIRALPEQWSRVEQNLRRLVQRCDREQMALTEDDDFQRFHDLHASTMSRKGQGLYLPRPAFQRWFEKLRGAGLCRLFHARIPGGRSVASLLVLLGPNAAHAVAAATDEEHLRGGASTFVRWKAFEVLSAGGVEAVDLTDASLGQVTHFKSQFGGELRLCLELDGPRSWRFRLGGAAGSLVRRVAKAEM